MSVFSGCTERLLHEYLLHLAVSGANDVQTLLELRQLNAVNCEELYTVSSLSVDCADAVNNRSYNLEILQNVRNLYGNTKECGRSSPARLVSGQIWMIHM